MTGVHSKRFSGYSKLLRQLKSLPGRQNPRRARRIVKLLPLLVSADSVSIPRTEQEAEADEASMEARIFLLNSLPPSTGDPTTEDLLPLAHYFPVKRPGAPAGWRHPSLANEIQSYELYFVNEPEIIVKTVKEAKILRSICLKYGGINGVVKVRGRTAAIDTGIAGALGDTVG